jgi:hypothetical protein
MKNGLIVNQDGSKRWYKDDKLHRVDGPAVELASGSKKWYIDDQFHRTDGPAIEHANGDKWWSQNDKLHRTDGPAVEYRGGKGWYINGRFHRAGGPAIERADGTQEWRFEGIRETREENNIRERPRLERELQCLRVHLPVESSGALKFPLVSLIIDHF